MTTLVLLGLLSAGPQWRSRFFQDVQLYRNGPKVTVQVAWLEPENLSTDSSMPAVVSVFSRSGGKATLLGSASVGNFSDATATHVRRKVGEAQLPTRQAESRTAKP